MAIWVGLIAYFILISGFISGRRSAILCNKVDIVIADSLSKRFLAKRDINEVLINSNQLPLGKHMSELNTSEIETLILKNSLIKNCKVYTTVDGVLNISLWQREPIVRIIDRRGQSYYLDIDGSVISMSRRFTPHLLVVNGNIPTPFSTKQVENIYAAKFNNNAQTLRDIHEFALFVRKNDFWNAQIVQMYVNAHQKFEIVPRIGPHLILLGKMDNYEQKLNKLSLFYKEGLNNVGWNQYLIINLEYKDQIVCSKI
jgi:cell division protein FtsQ